MSKTSAGSSFRIVASPGQVSNMSVTDRVTPAADRLRRDEQSAKLYTAKTLAFEARQTDVQACCADTAKVGDGVIWSPLAARRDRPATIRPPRGAPLVAYLVLAARGTI